MNKFFKLFFLLAGLSLFIWSLQTVDTSKVFNLLLQLGGGFLLIIAVYGGVTWIDTLAWKFNFEPEEASRFSLWQLWQIRQIGEAYNTITPLGTLGGEPVKAQLLKDYHNLSFKQGLASQVIARTTFLTGLILFFVSFLFFICRSQFFAYELQYVSLVGMGVFSLLILLFFLFQVTGMLGVLASWAGRLFKIPKEQGFLNQLHILDGLMSRYYKDHPGRALLSILLAFLGWVVGLGELYLVLYFLGMNPGLTDLWIIEGLAQFIRVGTFFIPLSIGAQEGGLILIFKAMGMTADLGLTVSFVRRIKELAWVALGLLLGWALAFKPAEIQPGASEG